MRTFTGLMFAVSIAAIAQFSAQAAPVISLFPNISPTDVNFPPPGPNLTSPSYAAYVLNALNGLRTNSTFVGGNQADTPSAFNVIGPVISNGSGDIVLHAGDMAASEFNSWRGGLSPTGAFAGEFGTHYRTSVAIRDSVAFTLMDVVFSGTYGPPLDSALGVPPGCCSASLDFVIDPASSRYIGLYWGADGTPGTADDVLFDASNPISPADLINDVFFIGAGELLVLPMVPGVTDAEVMDGWISLVASAGAAGFDISYSYSLAGVSSSVNVSLVPEPATWLLLLSGLAGLAVTRRRSDVLQQIV
jgi:hypothetical protein